MVRITPNKFKMAIPKKKRKRKYHVYTQAKMESQRNVA